MIEGDRQPVALFGLSNGTGQLEKESGDDPSYWRRRLHR